MENEQFTVITGASMGLGKALAKENARQGRHLVLVALPGEGIHELAYELKGKYGIEAVGYEADLTVNDQVMKLSDWINERYEVNLLINNAGIGGTRAFEKVSTVYISNVILLNNRALVVLTHRLLPNLKRQPEAFVLNIASIASFGPIPYKTVYPATKAFVYSFSRGLNTELADTNVFISVAHPGAMATNRDVTRRIRSYNKLVQATLLSPEKTAEICMRRLMKRRSLIIPGVMTRLSIFFMKIFPERWRLPLLRKNFSRELDQKQTSDG